MSLVQLVNVKKAAKPVACQTAYLSSDSEWIESVEICHYIRTRSGKK